MILRIEGLTHTHVTGPKAKDTEGQTVPTLGSASLDRYVLSPRRREELQCLYGKDRER